MKLAAIEEYGLRCALQLAALKEGDVASASQIAEKEGISVQYASKILHLFRKANLVQAVRGIQGGFRLTLPPEQISVKSVFQTLRDEPAQDSFCDHFKGQQAACVHMDECSVRPVWAVLTTYFDAVLEQLTLADLTRSEKDSQARVEKFAEHQLQQMRKRILPTERVLSNLHETRTSRP